MSEIAWDLLRPVDTGALVQQGFATGMGLVKQAQTQHALRAYLANPDDPKAYNALAAYNPQAAATIQTQQLQRRKLEKDMQDEAARKALGAQYASGDTAGARTAAIAGGNFDLAGEFDKLDEPTRKRTAEVWQQVGPVAYKLKQTKDPAAREALWAQAKPILAAGGADSKTLDGFDPLNDTQIEAAITTSQKISDLIEQGKITWRQRGEFGEYALDSMGRPVGSQNPFAQGNGSAALPTTTGVPQQAVAGVLSDAGMPPHVVAGFLGNFHAEGGYGGAKGDGGTASGIAQWRGERAANFHQVTGKTVAEATPEEQAQFVVWEMQHPEAAGMSVAERDAILKAPTAEAAAALIDQHYERSSGQHLGKRTAAARQIAANMGAAHSVGSKAEYDKLPSGAVFVAPDGSRRVKP